MHSGLGPLPHTLQMPLDPPLRLGSSVPIQHLFALPSASWRGMGHACWVLGCPSSALSLPVCTKALAHLFWLSRDTLGNFLK